MHRAVRPKPVAAILATKRLSSLPVVFLLEARSSTCPVEGSACSMKYMQAACCMFSRKSRSSSLSSLDEGARANGLVWSRANDGVATLERTAPPRSFTALRREMLSDRKELRLIKLYRTYRSGQLPGLTKSLDGSVGSTVAPDLDNNETLRRNSDRQHNVSEHNFCGGC